jgi:hypothetical protein
MTKSSPQYQLRNCSWGYRCEKTWDALIATDSPVERFCSQCCQPVYLCDTYDDLAITVARNQCAAFSARLIDKVAEEEMIMGFMQEPPDRIV